MREKLVIFILSLVVLFLIGFNAYQSYQINALANCVYEMSNEVGMYPDNHVWGAVASPNESDESIQRRMLYQYWYKK